MTEELQEKMREAGCEKAGSNDGGISGGEKHERRLKQRKHRQESVEDSDSLNAPYHTH